MAEIIRMPRMSDTMEEGVIVGWMKKVGEPVEPGDVLAEVETDKATMELENYHEGVLLHIGVAEGPVPVNGILAVVGEAGEDFQAELQAAMDDNGTQDAAPAEAPSAAEAMKKAIEVPATDKTPAPEAPSSSQETQRIKASPLARSIAEEAGIDLTKISGTGDNNRIIKRDIEAYLKTASKTVATPAPAASGSEKPAVAPFVFGGSEDTSEEVPVSQMRKVIARRLGESKFTAPHFYLTVNIDMTNTIAARKRLNEVAPTKISFNDLVVKACAVALRLHPAINSSWLGDTIRRNAFINIGVAVAVEDGLLVPVIRHADHKSLSQINVEVRELAGKAKERRLQPDQMQGNTFTISNLGMFDIEEFTAIINPPDACILAVGTIIEKPVVRDGELAIGNIMKVTLSCDHRVVDGATGAKFLQTVKSMLEDPIRLLV